MLLFSEDLLVIQNKESATPDLQTIHYENLHYKNKGNGISNPVSYTHLDVYKRQLVNPGITIS